MSEAVAAGVLPVRAELARKALHLSTAIVPVAWGLGFVTAPTVRAALVAAVAVALSVELARRTWPGAQRQFHARFGAMLRAHEARAFTGSTWLALAMLAVVLLFPAPAAIVALWAAAVGDGLASIVGRLTSHDASRKTWAGSLACVAATAAGAWWLAGAAIGPALLVGVAAAAAERPRVTLDDNVRVTVAAGAAAWVLLPR